MNGAGHRKWNLMQKNAMYWKWKWTYKLRESIISIEKEEKDLSGNTRQLITSENRSKKPNIEMKRRG